MNKIKNIDISIGKSTYPLYFIDSVLSMKYYINFNEYDNVFVVFDANLKTSKVEMDALRKLSHKIVTCEIVISEKTKNIKSYNNIINCLIKNDISRKSCIIAIGGGVLGNVVGFVASTIFRGVDLYHIPTTLISAADSVVSLKQAINSDFGKNMIGTYFAPKKVFVILSFFKKLPCRELKSGIVEFIKNILAIMPDEIPVYLENVNSKDIYSYEFISYIIEKSVVAKNLVLKNDEHEKKEGLILEYGHTIGHSIEFLSDGNIIHGEGVAFGMLVAAEISNGLGFLCEEDLEMHYLLLLDFINPDICSFTIANIDSIVNQLKHDNKKTILNDNVYSFVLLNTLGEIHKESETNMTYIDKDRIIMSMKKVILKLGELI